MAFGRSKSVIKYDEFINRIRKTFYFGETAAEDLRLSLPLASYASELFSKPHKDYSLNRLSTFNACKLQTSPCSLILAIIFLDRLNATDPAYVRRITPHELFIVSMMISTKFYVGYDEEIYLSNFALDGNMTEDRLKQLELEFLCAIDWNIYISNEEFFEKLADVEKTLAQREGISRGWLTYTELFHMMPSLVVAKCLLNSLFNQIAVMLVSYAAGVMTIVGACFLASQIPGHVLHRGSETVAVTGTTPARSLQSETMNGGDLSSATQMAVVNETLSEPQQNTCCSAINVEAELSGLERRYQEEQKAEELRARNNELDYVSYSMISTGSKQQSRVPLKFSKLENKWLNLKETYSEENLSCLKSDDNRTKSPRQNDAVTISPYFYDSFGNLTSMLFWEILADKASLVHLPLIWLKFI